jgi:hypothetical protein
MSAGGIAYFVLGILFFAFFYLLFGGFIDTNTSIANEQISDTSLHPSQLRMDTVGLLLKYWIAIPIVFLILSGYILIRNALRDATGEVY